ncbi:MAG: 16S rRNA (cytosine(1402)-N(4))-methyltransferase RsmH [Verrucomicrobia bacterium]|nr:MAG: 16S rRNA (cytosine(1402)-N(4))-methyltransferase RsmH [Verrucomicrobiota bacterium]
MSDPDPSAPRPPRRPRYGGSNPRRFEQKYKEHAGERYPETVAKVIASGKTPAGTHVPVMMEECLAALGLREGGVGVDVTLGYGGHAARILERITPAGILLGMDVDPLEMPKTVARLRALGFAASVFEALRCNYAGLAKVLAERGIDGVDFVFADLGCSSMQLDDPARGFSFKTAGPLDMRLNPGRGLSAAEWLARVAASKLETALHAHADEPRAAELSVALAGRRFADTLALASAVRECVGGRGVEVVELTLRRVFQALRIAVNEEFTALDGLLRVLPGCLKSGGRAVFLTFHSGEDRRVKKAFQAGLRSGEFASISEEVITASPQERHLNPRSSSAKLRWALKA